MVNKLGCLTNWLFDKSCGVTVWAPDPRRPCLLRLRSAHRTGRVGLVKNMPCFGLLRASTGHIFN
jgi:hypothetical protein